MHARRLQDYAELLTDLHDECGPEPLNPNEVVAVLKVVGLVANVRTTTALDQHGIYLPDDTSVLVAAPLCVFNDAPWLR